ncbi:MAG: TonB-dependent receptor [Bryobacterales bacterium]|nr:TonB-dependent receptor [Bryobacterales bacterium]
MKTIIRTAILISSCLFGTGQLSAQVGSATLTGTVLDPSGAPVADATVTLESLRTGAVTESLSSGAGLYRLAGLDTGAYRLVAEKDSFRAYRAEDIELVAGQEVTRNIRLEIGLVSEEITVVGSFAEIERVASSGVRGSSYDPSEVASIPMVTNNVGRNYRAISYQTPGVGFARASHAPFTVNGNRPLGAVNTMVDSAEYNDPVAGNLMGRGLTEQPVSMETVEAFEMQTSNFKAEFGRASGAVVNLVTKRGGNEWHGSAYHFFQNEKLNARGALLSQRPERRLNMPGVTLGGPVVRNKLFFFGGYELGVRNQYRASSTIQTLTAEQRARAAPSVRALLPLYPEPNVPGTNLHSAAVPSPQTSQTGLLRLDWQPGDRHRLSARGNWVNAIGPTRDRLAAGNAATDNYSRSGVVSVESSLSLRAFNQFRATYSTYNAQVSPGSPSLGDPAINGQAGVILVTGLPRLGTFIPLTQTRFHNYTYSNDFTLVTGRHSLKAGVIGRHIQYNSVSDRNFNGLMIFPSIGAFLGGQPLIYSRAFGESRIDQRNHEFSLYAQDDWRITPSLTLNLGLRYEYYGVPSEKFGRLDQDYRSDPNNLAPRAGFAWNLGGADKTVLRGGYGFFFSPLQMGFIAQSRFAPPRVTTYSRFRPRLPDPLEGARVGSDEYVLDRGLVNPYVQNWNLTLERQLWGTGSVGSIAYVGNRALKLTRTSLPNGGPNLRAPFRPDPSRGVVSYLTGGAYSDYDSLQASMRARLGRGLSYRLAYTFSRTIDVASGSGTVPTDQSNWNLDRSFADFHQPHVLTAYGTYQLPFARRRRLLGGWQIGTLLWARSGSPFSLLSNTDNPNGSRINRINDVAGTIDRSPVGSQRFRLAQGVEPDQILPAPATVGSLARNSELGPSFFDLHVTLEKEVPVRDTMSLRFRAEVFNILNRVNYHQPINNIGDGRFGQAVRTYEPRQFQLSLRVAF